MVSMRRIAVATSSATIRLTTFLFLRWIPGHHFVPLVVTSLVVYLSSIFSLLKDTQPHQTQTARARGYKSASSRAKAGDSVLKTLLTGLPSTKWPLWTRITILINVILALLTLDFLTRGILLYPTTNVAFSRVGYVSPTTANLVFREPDSARLPVAVMFQEISPLSQDWYEEGIVYKLDNSTDFTTSVTLTDLKPATRYRYSLSNNKSGTFITAPSPETPEASRLSFVTSSCLKPNFPYSLLSHPLRVPGIEQMTDALAKLPKLLRPAFMLFLGDFIYIDVPWRFGSAMSHYRSEYRRIYSSPSWTHGPEGNRAIDLPWLHTLDDHEIENDWSQGNKTAPYPAAADPFIHYHVRGNPPIPQAPFAHPDNVTYFAFTHGPASFFMLDTRTYRTEPSHKNSTILGDAQLQSLLAYISTPEPAGTHWKIISSSVPFTKNWHVGTTDTWGGFLDERSVVFESMWRAEREQGIRIVLLSGDRHEFATTRFPDPELNLGRDQLLPNTAGLGVHEFSVGPLSMFYLPIRTYHQTDSEDVMVKYAPNGNSKFGLVDISDVVEDVGSATAAAPVRARSSVLTYTLYVDGEVVWKYRLSVPLDRDSSVHTPSLPPGRVVEDDIPDLSWSVVLGTVVGRVPELTKRVVEAVNDLYFQLADQLWKIERLD
ncbi:Alkaline phosphatase D-related protein [Penicillium concentricum]|uniref:Alkaline phosphatase D-related protein n=1 Tax=Penicillium concentricum TaxID=293559 RepID=A0A9W9RH55_9EURO|nr:Alkaline phosphatase D-related protein [Penicillium concentricum]KAJ5360202.1 Alkaline phosphatase D-related protein [Penicillium concentricum]